MPERGRLVEGARALLLATTALRLDDGTTLPVDDGVLAGRVTAEEASVEAATRAVDALGELAGRSVTIDLPSADASLRQLVGEVRARDAQVSIADVLSRWLARWIAGLRGSPPDPRIVLVVGAGLGLALLVLVIAILGRGLRERFRREVVLPELRAERGPDPAAHLRGADEALRRGRLSVAVHELYLYAIAVLAAREAIRYDPSLTDRELLARAGAIPGAGPLRDLVALHDLVWYGLREAGADEAARARALAVRAVA